MSFDFAIKDITRKWSQSLSYIKTIAMIMLIAVLFIHLFNGFGFIVFNQVANIFNYTTFDIFSQYFRFIVYSTMFLTVIWILIINHSIITHKAKDLAIIKAVGAIQKRLNSYFITIIIFIDIIGMVLGIGLGFLIYLVLFFAFSALGFNLFFFTDFFFTPILFIIILFLTIIVNGYELYKISEKRYSKISSGDIEYGYSAIGGLKLIPRWISKISYQMKIAVTNLTRKKKQFRRILLILSVSMIICVTISTGSTVVGHSVKSMINGAQGGDTLLIGHTDLVNTYEARYEEFSNSSLIFTNDEFDFTESQYLFDESLIDDLMNDELYKDVNTWDKRLFLYEDVHEVTGIVISEEEDEQGNSYSQYTQVGLDRESIIPVVGIEFGKNTEDWEIFGTYDIESQDFAITGDTLAYNFFQSAVYQSIELLSGSSKIYNVTGVVYDSFCKGNATYIPLNSLQEDFGIINKVNVVVLRINSDINTQNLLNDLNNEIKIVLGSDFEVIDITETFEENISSINYFIIISYAIIAIFVILIIYSLLEFQKANFREKYRDFAVIQAMGGKAKLIKSMIFYEDLFLILIASSIALGVSLNFNSLFLLSTAIMPPLTNALLIWALLTLIVIFVTKISVKWLYSDFKKKKSRYMRIFEK